MSPGAVRRSLIERQGVCFYCGCELSDDSPIPATIDHFVPQSRGGGDDAENLRLSCRRCNQRKSDFPIEALVFHTRGRHLMFCRERSGYLRKLARRIHEPLHTWPGGEALRW